MVSGRISPSNAFSRPLNNVIGKAVDGLTSDGTEVTGTVDSVSIKAGKAYLNVADQSDNPTLHEIPLGNVREVF